MKKVATALVALMFVGSISFAQSNTNKTDAPKAKTEKTEKKADKKAAKEKKKMDKKTEEKTAPSK